MDFSTFTARGKTFFGPDDRTEILQPFCTCVKCLNWIRNRKGCLFCTCNNCSAVQQGLCVLHAKAVSLSEIWRTEIDGPAFCEERTDEEIEAINWPFVDGYDFVIETDSDIDDALEYAGLAKPCPKEDSSSLPTQITPMTSRTGQVNVGTLTSPIWVGAEKWLLLQERLICKDCAGLTSPSESPLARHGLWSASTVPLESTSRSPEGPSPKQSSTVKRKADFENGDLNPPKGRGPTSLTLQRPLPVVPPLEVLSLLTPTSTSNSIEDSLHSRSPVSHQEISRQLSYGVGDQPALGRPGSAFNALQTRISSPLNTSGGTGTRTSPMSSSTTSDPTRRCPSPTCSGCSTGMRHSCWCLLCKKGMVPQLTDMSSMLLEAQTEVLAYVLLQRHEVHYEDIPLCPAHKTIYWPYSNDTAGTH